MYECVQICACISVSTVCAHAVDMCTYCRYTHIYTLRPDPSPSSLSDIEHLNFLWA